MYCGKCGSAMNQGMKFCTKCGEPNKRYNETSPVSEFNIHDEEIRRKEEELKLQILKLEEEKRRKKEAFEDEQKRKEEARLLEILKLEEEKKRIQEEEKRKEEVERKQREHNLWLEQKRKEEEEINRRKEEERLQKIREEEKRKKEERESLEKIRKQLEIENEKLRKETEKLHEDNRRLEIEKEIALKSKTTEPLGLKNNEQPKRSSVNYKKLALIIIPIITLIGVGLYFFVLNPISFNNNKSKNDLVLSLNQSAFFDPADLTKKFVEEESDLTETQKTNLINWASSSSIIYNKIKSAQAVVYSKADINTKYQAIENITDNFQLDSKTPEIDKIPFSNLNSVYGVARDSLVLIFISDLINDKGNIVKTKEGLVYNNGTREIIVNYLLQKIISTKNSSILTLNYEITDKIANFTSGNTPTNSIAVKESREAHPTNQKIPERIAERERIPALDAHTIKKLLVGKTWSECDQTIRSIGDITSFSNTPIKTENDNTLKTSVSLTLSVDGETYVAKATLICSYNNKTWSLNKFNPGFCDIK